ncbi:hypothetical protein Y024_4639 [Burkholderia pseudomallei TSV44]|nr:hypothetical protein Y024_4639 [Burkholderia pseudomallei TSV44]
MFFGPDGNGCLNICNCIVAHRNGHDFCSQII